VDLFAELRVLILDSCEWLTPGGLLSWLTMPVLKHFTFVTYREVPESFLRQIVEQNPSLESISVNFSGCGWEDKPEAKEAFINKHPRIKALNNLVKCLRKTRVRLLIL